MRQPLPAAALLAAAALLIPSCSGSNKSESVIKPVTASIQIDAIPDSTAVFFQKSTTAPPFPDFVLVDVMVRDAAQRSFDDFTLEIQFNPGLVNIGSVATPATPWGTCTFSTSGNCTASTSQLICCANTISANFNGDLFIVVTRPAGATTSWPIFGDVKLLTLGFIATTTGQSRIQLIYNLATDRDGECEILQDPGAPSPFVDLKIPCLDGNATLTATR